jgi:molybdenum cofactor cytidylyltransferase
MSVASFIVLILASGRGERFLASGGQGSKLDAMVHGKTVLQHTVAAVRASGLSFHVETDPHPGMGDSIAAAVGATRNADGWLILPGDLPLILPATLRAVADALTQHPVVVPIFEAQHGHPVGFDIKCRDALLALRGNQGAMSVVHAWGAMKLLVTDAGAVTDLDTMDDLRQLAQGLALRVA